MRKFIIYALLLISVVVTADLYGQYNKIYFYNMGRTYIMSGHYEDAIEMLNVMLKADDDAHEGYFLRGVAKYNLDDLLGAEMDFTKAIESNPVFTRAYQYRAITRSRMANYDDALKDYREAIALRPDITDSYYSRGITLLLNNQFQEAIYDFDIFIKQYSMICDAYINRGTAYLMLEDTVKAYEDFNRAIVTNRENPNGYSRLGSLYIAQHRYSEAIEELSMALKYDPDHIQSLFSRAISYSYENRPVEAVADFSAIIKLDSTLSLAYFNRALVRSQMGDYNNALTDYDNVIHYSPQNVLVYYNRAALNHRLGDLDGALYDYSKAIELYPDFANAYLGRSNIKYLLSDLSGSQSDKRIAEQKIAEYRSKLNDSTFSIYADTSRHFNQLLSFDNSGGFKNLSSKQSDIAMLPMFKFVPMAADTTLIADHYRYYREDAESFMADIERTDYDYTIDVSMVSGEGTMSLEQIYALDDLVGDEINHYVEPSWQQLFKRGMTQAIIKQYTSAINLYTRAIDLAPSNPFLYINRSTTRAEMIEFVSTIDNRYHRLTIDEDPVNRLKENNSHTYDYSEAIKDIDRAIELYPDYAYAYYNRANLYCLSGHTTEAIEDYTKAIELNVYFAEAYYNRGLLQIYLKDSYKGCLDVSKAGELGISQAYEVLKIYTEK